MTDLTVQERQAGTVQDWLLAILRFAVTRDPIDRGTIMATAQMMDEARRFDPTTFTFFSRVSSALCAAIADESAPNRADILRRHITQIDNPRLRGAFEAAIGLPAIKTPNRVRSRTWLWDGLSSTSGV